MVGVYIIPASQPFLAYVIVPAWPGTPFTALLGAHTSAPHWICTWVSLNKQVVMEKQAHTIYGQDKGTIFSILSYRRVYRLSVILLKSVNSEAPAFLCMR